MNVKEQGFKTLEAVERERERERVTFSQIGFVYGAQNRNRNKIKKTKDRLLYLLYDSLSFL